MKENWMVIQKRNFANVTEEEKKFILGMRKLLCLPYKENIVSPTLPQIQKMSGTNFELKEAMRIIKSLKEKEIVEDGVCGYRLTLFGKECKLFTPVILEK